MPLPTSVTDLVSFELLLSVAELGSIGAAGHAHGMSQPAASARLKTLEARLGVPLLHRSPTGATLTPTGELVAGWAHTAVTAAAQLADNVAVLRHDHEAHLRIAASMTIAEYLVPRWLVAVRAEVPGLAPSLWSGNSGDVAEMVLAGRADLGFIESPDTPVGLETQVVATDELVVIVAPGHPWAHRTVTAQELAATAFVSREAGSGTRSAWERALAGHVLAAAAVELSSTTAIKAAVLEGLGPAVVSSLAVVQEIDNGILARVPTTGLVVQRSLRAVWPVGRALRGAANDLVAVAMRDRRRARPDGGRAQPTS